MHASKVHARCMLTRSFPYGFPAQTASVAAIAVASHAICRFPCAEQEFPSYRNHICFHSTVLSDKLIGKMLTYTLFTLAASLSTASAVVYQAFNYGAGADFENDFKTAKALVGTSGFTSARLCTMIQPGTTNTPTEAIQAAIDTGTTLLLGLWASEAQDAFNNELAALSSAISQYPFVKYAQMRSEYKARMYRTA